MDELEFQFKAFQKLRKQKASVALNLLVSLFCYLVVCSGGNRQTDRHTNGPCTATLAAHARRGLITSGYV